MLLVAVLTSVREQKIDKKKPHEKKLIRSVILCVCEWSRLTMCLMLLRSSLQLDGEMDDEDFFSGLVVVHELRTVHFRFFTIVKLRNLHGSMAPL